MDGKHVHGDWISASCRDDIGPRSEQLQMIILGIDPGSRITGFGLIDTQGHQLKHIECGMIQTQSETDFHSRLYKIFADIQKLIQIYQPQSVSIEQIFTAHNAASALKLGQARGAAIAAVASCHLPIAEYTARAVKLAVTGYGAAEKHQVQQMVAKLLKLKEPPDIDAADALAIAICHAHHQKKVDKI